MKRSIVVRFKADSDVVIDSKSGTNVASSEASQAELITSFIRRKVAERDVAGGGEATFYEARKAQNKQGGS